MRLSPNTTPQDGGWGVDADFFGAGKVGGRDWCQNALNACREGTRHLVFFGEVHQVADEAGNVLTHGDDVVFVDAEIEDEVEDVFVTKALADLFVEHLTVESGAALVAPAGRLAESGANFAVDVFDGG